MTHHQPNPNKNAPSSSARSAPAPIVDASSSPLGIVDLPDFLSEPAAPPSAVLLTAAACASPDAAAAFSSAPGMALTRYACGGVVVMDRPHVLGEFPSSYPLRDSLSRLAAATRSVDDLGSVQDALKMSTDGQPRAGLDTVSVERETVSISVTAGETAPNSLPHPLDIPDFLRRARPAHDGMKPDARESVITIKNENIAGTT